MKVGVCTEQGATVQVFSPGEHQNEVYWEQKFLGLRGHTVDCEVRNVSDVGVQPLEDKIRNTKGNADLQSIVSAAADEYKRMRIEIYS